MDTEVLVLVVVVVVSVGTDTVDVFVIVFDNVVETVLVTSSVSARYSPPS